MFIPSQFSLKRLAACCGVVSLLVAAPVTVIAEESSNHQVLLAQQSDELEEAKRLNQQVYQLYQQGKYNEAIAIAERVLEMMKKLLGDEHPDVATSLNNLAQLYYYQGRYSEAEPPLHTSTGDVSETAG